MLVFTGGLNVGQRRVAAPHLLFLICGELTTCPYAPVIPDIRSVSPLRKAVFIDLTRYARLALMCAIAQYNFCAMPAHTVLSMLSAFVACTSIHAAII